MHKKPYGFEDGSFQAAGGVEGLTKLVDKFYEEMDHLPEARVIRQMHQSDLTQVKDKLVRFLCGWLGGPRLFQEKYGQISIPLVHRPFPIGVEESAAWMSCMQKAVSAQPFEEDFKRYLIEQLAVPAGRVINKRSQP